MAVSPVRGRSSMRDVMNDHIRTLAASLHNASVGGVEHDRPKTVLEWAKKYRRIDGMPFSLDNYLPLIEVYEDQHQAIVIIKPAQRGASEYAINYACFALDVGAAAWAPQKLGLNVGYIFPTIDSLRDFSKERIGGLEDETEYLADMFSSGRYQDITFKQIRAASFLYLRGGWSASGLKSFPGDVMILDEYDEMVPAVPALADKRMNASPVRRRVDISTPKLPHQGIHARYLLSDQRIYVQPCPNCKKEHRYEFFRDVTVDGQRYDDWQYYDQEHVARSRVELRCPSCEVAVDEAGRTVLGRYVPQNPDSTLVRGYHIPALAFPTPSLHELTVKAVDPNPTAFEEFMRQDLGEPYQRAGAGITEEMLIQLAVGLENGKLPAGVAWEYTTMGVDIGSRLHCKISGRYRGHWYLRRMVAVRSFDEVSDLMQQYRVGMCVVDAYPEAHAVRQFVQRHKGRAVAADYPTSMTALKTKMIAPEPQQAVQDGLVRVNRTMALDAVYADIASARERWPQEFVDDPEVRQHMTAMQRHTSIDGRGQMVATWHRLRPDHYFHAAVYERVARMLAPKPRRPARVFSGRAKTSMPSGTGYRRPSPRRSAR